jgi:hypothetical protein
MRAKRAEWPLAALFMCACVTCLLACVSIGHAQRPLSLPAPQSPTLNPSSSLVLPQPRENPVSPATPGAPLSATSGTSQSGPNLPGTTGHADVALPRSYRSGRHHAHHRRHHASARAGSIL